MTNVQECWRGLPSSRESSLVTTSRASFRNLKAVSLLLALSAVPDTPENRSLTRMQMKTHSDRVSPLCSSPEIFPTKSLLYFVRHEVPRCTIFKLKSPKLHRGVTYPQTNKDFPEREIRLKVTRHHREICMSAVWGCPHILSKVDQSIYRLCMYQICSPE